MKSFFDNKFTVIGKLDIFDDIDIVRVGKYNYPIRNSLIKKVKFYEGKVVRAVIGRDSLTKEIKILSIEEENSKDYNRKKMMY